MFHDASNMKLYTREIYQTQLWMLSVYSRPALVCALSKTDER
jgi:hypothetical protein